LPQNILWVPFAAITNMGNVCTDLVLKFIQPFEGPDLFFSGQIQTERATVDSKVMRKLGEKNLPLIVTEIQEPIFHVFTHATIPPVAQSPSAAKAGLKKASNRSAKALRHPNPIDR
jgi:hypothetical protein